MKQAKQYLLVAGGVALASLAGLASATTTVDYASIMTAVTTELAGGITAAAAGVGIVWGVKIGVRVVRSLF